MQKMQQREQEMFGQVLSDEDLMADLEALEAEDAAQELGEIGPQKTITTGQQVSQQVE